MRKMICAVTLLAAASTALFAAENLIQGGDGEADAANWPGATINTASPKSGGGCLEFADSKWVYSKQSFKIDDTKTYTLKMSMRSVDPAKLSSGYIGISMYDADGKVINSHHVGTVAGTETTLVDAVAAGAKEIKVADASSWKAGNQVAFNVKSDLSDLPNRNVFGPAESIEQDGGAWKVTLRNPVKGDFAAGTPVRQHVSATGQSYGILAGKKVPAEWTDYSVTISGRDLGTAAAAKFWPTAATFKVCLVPNYNKKVDSVLLIDDISLTEE